MPNDKGLNPSGTLSWPELIPGTLIKRYKRFLADVKLKDGRVVTAHCPNTGSMQGCSEPGRPVYLSFHDNPKRKLKYTWELIKMPTSLVGTNTLVPNRLVKASIEAGDIKELKGYDTVKAEVNTGHGSRLDLLLTAGGLLTAEGKKPSCFVEIKNCTMVTDGLAAFPDAVTTRGLKHLVELQRLARQGYRSVIFYLVQRMDARLFRPADKIDPAYGAELRRAKKNRVEIIVYDVVLDLEKIVIGSRVPYRL